MALVEGVVGKRLDLVPPLLPHPAAVAGGLAAVDELLFLLRHLLADLLAAGFPQVVGLLQAVAGELLGDPHHGLLVNHESVGVREDFRGRRVQEFHLRPTHLAVGVGDVHVVFHRARPVEGHEGGDVIDVAGEQGAEQGAHGRALQLEDAGGVAALEHRVGALVVQRHRVGVQVEAAQPCDVRHGVGDDVEGAQAQEVHLEQAEFLDGIHVVLRDDRDFVDLLLVGGFSLDGHVLDQRVGRDHHGGGVDPVLPAQSLKAQRHVHDFAHLGVLGVHGAQIAGQLVAGAVGALALQARPQWGRTAHDRLGNGLGDPVTHRVGMIQHAGRVAHRGTSLDGGERDDLRHVVAPVAVGGVADQVVAVPRVEVHVDVGHLAAAGVEETFEQQVVVQRVQVGDAEAVGDGAAGGAATAGAHPDAVGARVADEIPDDEEVRGETHRGDNPQLVRQAVRRGVG